jgi:hypothetical protein
VTATTHGGALLVQTNLSLVNGSHATCRPLIDGQWAGDYSGQPKSINDPFWTEGLMAVGCCGGGWRKWANQRIYAGVLAGSHIFEVQCVTDGGSVTMNDNNAIFSSWAVFEVQ